MMMMNLNSDDDSCDDEDNCDDDYNCGDDNMIKMVYVLMEMAIVG